jgi:hypothetical protein
MADGVSKSPRSVSATVGKGQLQRMLQAFESMRFGFNEDGVCCAGRRTWQNFCEAICKFSLACIGAARLSTSPPLSAWLSSLQLCSDNNIVRLLDRHGVKGEAALPVRAV